MTLYKLLDTIKGICKNQPNVGDIFYGNVTELNERQDVEYPAVVITQDTHYVNSQEEQERFGIILFAVDRLLEDKSNQQMVQDWANNLLLNVIHELEKLDIDVYTESTVEVFNQRFDSLCAGAFIRTSITVDVDTCDEIDREPISDIKGLEFMAVIDDMEIWLREYGTFSAAGTPKLEYTYDGRYWLEWDFKNNGLKLKKGKSVWVRSKTLFKSAFSGWGTNYRNFDFVGDGMVMCFGYIDYLHGTDFENVIYGGDYAQLFKDNKKLLKAPDIAVYDYSGASRYYQFQDMFAGCSSMVYGPKELRCNIPKSYMWTRMFDGCTALLETPKLIVEYNENTSDSPGSYLFSQMFRNCTALRKINWDIKFNNVLRPSNMNYFQLMFQNCTSLVECNFKLDNIRYIDQSSFQSMFEGCTALQKAPEFADNYDIRDNTLQQFYRMFYGCSSLIDVPKIIKVTAANKTAFTQMFEGCTALENGVEKIDVDYIGNAACQRMFYGCSKLKNAAELTATQIGTQGCEYMYYNCVALNEVPDELPATNIEGAGYRYMFYGDKVLTKTPIIKATDLTNGTAHFYQMFYNCSALTDVQDKLYPMTMTTNCYYQMFDGCTALTKAPELPATTGVSGCYAYMFRSTKVNRIKCLLNGNVGTSFTTSWVSGISGTIREGVFIKHPNATWPAAGVSSVPVGWTIIDDGEPEPNLAPQRILMKSSRSNSRNILDEIDTELLTFLTENGLEDDYINYLNNKNI